MPRSFAVGERFGAFIDAQVRNGRYSNASEVVRDALRLLESQEKLRELHAELRHLAEEDRASDPSDGERGAILDRLEDKYRTIIARRQE
ncbi:MAG TPA: type II toxin-antitoxin system ParD family antitoxin [Stellaceae bacterium]